MAVATKLRNVARMASKPEGQAALLLRLAKARYGVHKSRQWEGIHQAPQLTDDTEWHETMRRDGILIVPNYVAGADLAALQAEVHSLEGFDAGTYQPPEGIQYVNREDDGICARQVTPDLPHAHALTVDNDRLLRLAQSLYGPRTRLSAASVLSKYNADAIDSSNVPHWDDALPRLKAFIYVDDVGPESAPTVYFKGSHRGVGWRQDKDFASVYMPQASAGGSWWAANELGYEKVVATGKAGTLVFFDALGLHAGSQLKAGVRRMLMSMFTTHMDYGFRPF